MITCFLCGKIIPSKYEPGEIVLCRECADGFKRTFGGWISVKDRLPDTAGEYIVAYHPCHWNNVNWDKVDVGIDNFRGKTTWAKHKYQRVTNWMPLPEPPEQP